MTYELPKITHKNFNSNLFITWQTNRKDRFVVFDKQRKVYAKIYEYKDNWYIYYQKLGYRLKVKDFTEAMIMIEKEIEESWRISENK